MKKSKKAKILFLSNTVTKSPLIRPYLFAHLFSKNYVVEIVGPKTNGLYFKSTKDVKITGVKGNYLNYLFKILRKGLSYDVIAIFTLNSFNSFSGLIFRLLGKRVVFDFDDNFFAALDFDYKEKRKDFSYWFRFLKLKFSYFCRHFANEIVVSSTQLQKKFGGHVFPIPVDTSFFSSALGSKIRRKFGNKKLVVFSGVIRRYKGVDDFVRAFPLVKKSFPNVKFLIIGSLSFAEFAKEIVKEARSISSDIIFVGHKEFKEMPDYFAAADCLVLPNPDISIHRFQTPNKLIHYMASGKPIVATDVGSVKKILDNGKAGVVVEASNVEKLAEGIKKVLKDKKFAQEIGKNAQKKCWKEFDSNTVAKKLEKIYLG